jgi:Fe-S oxidoreductase
MAVEEFNAKEEIKEIVENCINCGMCNSICPVLRIVRKEHYSPRGRAIALKENIFEKLVYDCTLCKSCEKNCPLDIKLCEAFIKARQILVFQKKENSKHKEMIHNLETESNVYGIKQEGF